jgi:hypothetical protein
VLKERKVVYRLVTHLTKCEISQITPTEIDYQLSLIQTSFHNWNRANMDNLVDIINSLRIQLNIEISDVNILAQTNSLASPSSSLVCLGLVSPPALKPGYQDWRVRCPNDGRNRSRISSL